MTAASPLPVHASRSCFARTIEPGVATLTLTSPKDRNALGLQMIDTLIVALADLGADAVRAVVLAGEGPALSGGHNLKEMQAHRNDADQGRDYFERLFARCATLMQAIVALPKPVIAAVEGVATAAGCQLVATSDLAVAGENARFALSGINAGLFCSTPLVAVARAVPRKAALELALTGAMIDAAEALAHRPRQPRRPGRKRARRRAGAGRADRHPFRRLARHRQTDVLRADRGAALGSLQPRGEGDGREPRRARLRRGHGRLHREAEAGLRERRMTVDGLSDDAIRDILTSVRTIAVVGASPNPARPSNGVLAFLIERGYECWPVNPGQAGKLIHGRPVSAKLADVPVAIDMVDVFRNSDAAGGVVDEALKLDPLPRVIWMQLGVDQRAGGGAGAGERRDGRDGPLPAYRNGPAVPGA